jgi:aminoglycoside phosphotransferase (APT) family kinase protein
VELPPFCDLSADRLNAILTKHGLDGARVVRQPEVGIFNAIFLVGDSLVLRVPRQHHAFIEAAEKESVAVPLARQAGLRTPELVAFDGTCEELPVPYSLYARVPGQTLETVGVPPAASSDAYREVGRDLARLHAAIDHRGPIATFQLEGLPEPDDWPDELGRQGYLGTLEVRWLDAWMSRLKERIADAPQPDVFRHGDVQATNVMVTDSLDYLALLDWGACGWGNPAHDFAGVPFDAAPLMLEGYRERRAVARDGSFEAHIVLRQLHLSLFLLRRTPQPGRSWAERPLAMLLDLMRSLAQTRDEAFARLAP